ncbi:hypothetical protein C5167_015016 [Papaver somniferum]|uniref:Uncharacterized protein n=1 Tax=Papaver somniferum TaxID=3469 RepID=A0A4Y7J8X7_PAPSO|nr:hypothetical protein C5167_015016 [Papaver somniferum]
MTASNMSSSSFLFFFSWLLFPSRMAAPAYVPQCKRGESRRSLGECVTGAGPVGCKDRCTKSCEDSGLQRSASYCSQGAGCWCCCSSKPPSPPPSPSPPPPSPPPSPCSPIQSCPAEMEISTAPDQEPCKYILSPSTGISLYSLATA